MSSVNLKTLSEKISYEVKTIKDFCMLTQGVIDSHGHGCDPKVYEAIWKLLGNRENATVFITLLLGKAALHEKSVKNENDDSLVNEFTEHSVEAILREMRLDSHQPNPNHVHLSQRKDGIRRRKEEEMKDTGDEDNDYPLQVQYTVASILNTILYVATAYRIDQTNPALLYTLDRFVENKKSSFLAREIRETLFPPLETLTKYIQVCCGYDLLTYQDTEMIQNHSMLDPLMNLPNYIYSRLQTVCRVPKYTDNVVSELKYMLSTKKDAKNILGLMSLLIPQLAINPTTVQQISQSLLPFFLEPQPIGANVRKLLKGLKRELSSPGALMRERFERSIRVIKTPNGVQEVRRVVHVLFNSYAVYSQYISKYDIMGDLPEEEVDNCKANLLLNVYESLDGHDAQELLDLPLEILSKYYRQVADLMKKAEVDGVAKYKTELTSIKATMLKDVTKGTKYVIRQRAPKIPEVAFNFVKVPYEESLEKCVDKEKKVHPKSCIQVLLGDIVAKTREEAPTGVEPYVDVLIAGGSATVTRVAHSVSTAAKSTTPFKGVKFRYYLLPLGSQNLFGSWLEKFDGWYSRHVYHPALNCLPVLPMIKTESDAWVPSTFNKSNYTKKGVRLTVAGTPPTKTVEYKAPKGFLTPPRMMRTTLSDYCIDAINPLPMRVYGANLFTNEVQVIGGSSKNMKSKDFIVVSFTQRIEVGNHVEDLARRQMDASQQKLLLSYIGVDTKGQTSSNVSFTERNYSSIVIKAVAKYGDKGNLALPTRSWLEVNFLDDTRKKKKFKELDVGANVHVNAFTLESATSTQASKFTVMIDGELYGPVHKLIIEKNKTQTMNFMTFEQLDEEGFDDKPSETDETK